MPWVGRIRLFRWRLLLTLAYLASSVASSSCDDGADLFTDSDNILALNFSDLRTTVYDNSKVSWLLLLYSSYNGYSIEYAGEFKQFARSIARWNHTLRIAAVNLAMPHNSEVLPHFGIRGLPALLFVKRMSLFNDSSVVLLPRDTDLLLSGIFAEFERLVPQLKPVSTVSRFLRLHRRRKNVGRVIFLEELEGDLSRQAIMTYLTAKNVQVVWRVSNRLKAGEARFAEFRSVSKFRHKQTRQWRVFGSLSALLKAMDSVVLGREKAPAQTSEILTRCTVDADEKQPTEDDLLSSVTDLLSDPCPSHWVSLTNFVKLLAESLGDVWPKLKPLKHLAASLPPSTPTQEDWLQLLKNSGLPGQPVEQWKSCTDSEHQQTCGAWILLHVLTSVSPLPVLHSAANFFEHCGDPLDISSELKQVPSGANELLSLWRLHNARRLLPFPSDALCPGCHLSEDDVQLFLLHWYRAPQRASLTQTSVQPLAGRDKEKREFCDSVPQLPPLQFTLLLLLLPAFLLILRCLVRLPTRPGFRV